MGTYHYHVGRCPHCNEVPVQRGCQLFGCGFAMSWKEKPRGENRAELEECPRCGEQFWIDYGDVPRDN